MWLLFSEMRLFACMNLQTWLLFSEARFSTLLVRSQKRSLLWPTWGGFGVSREQFGSHFVSLWGALGASLVNLEVENGCLKGATVEPRLDTQKETRAVWE